VDVSSARFISSARATRTCEERGQLLSERESEREKESERERERDVGRWKDWQICR